MKKLMTIPNLITLSRVLFLPLLYIFIKNDMLTAFLIGYILIGLTDFIDGKLARRLNQVTNLGQALDSICDLFFYISSAYFIHVLYYSYLEPNMVLLIVFFSILALSFIVSGVLCKKPIMMHTSLLRLNAVFVYFVIILSYFWDTTYFITAILGIYIIGFLEEILIFIKFGEVDADTTSIFSLIKSKEE